MSLKLVEQTIVLVPFMDTEGMKNWARLTFRGKVDRRRVYRTVRQFVKLNFNKTVDNEWVKINAQILKATPDEMLRQERELEQTIEEWIDRMELKDDEIEGEGYSDNQDSDVEEAGREMRLVSSCDCGIINRCEEHS